ncbi:hypothetical protein HGRIS_014799 [Hohenbuehelia grisea]|uniref:Uncharacterized protein n=1 Tax=Hohenbuehelia grisea TaxID=104357 RepID=A0ABR3IQU4_9AGAR
MDSLSSSTSTPLADSTNAVTSALSPVMSAALHASNPESSSTTTLQPAQATEEPISLAPRPNSPPPPHPLPVSIANFKPTPREILSGIAPHLFEDGMASRGRRRRPRSVSRGQQGRSSSRGRQSRPPGVCAADSRSRTSSPLRISAVLTTVWDENGNWVVKSEQELGMQTVACTVHDDGSSRVGVESGKNTKTRRHKLRLADKSRWRTLNIGNQLKTIIIKLKHSSSKSDH